MTSPISTPSATRSVARWFALAATIAVLPVSVHAQTAPSGKWVANISQLVGGSQAPGGSAELRVEPRNEKQSRAKLEIRNAKRETRFSWDIAVGRCNDDGARIAPQAAFTALQAGMDGGISQSNNIPKLESGKLYYVRVFEGGKSFQDNAVWGCANLAELP